MRSSPVRAGAWRARYANAQKAPVFRYMFAHGMENDPQLKAQGVNHTIEHAFLFPWERYQPTAADLTVQQRMIAYWTHIARDGNPNGGGHPQWPAATPENDAYLEIGATTAAKQGPAEAHCDFWDGLTLPWPHL